MKNKLLYLIILLVSCQDEITINPSYVETKLVVEGSIEPGFPPYVILTKNEGYFDPININTYNNLFVNNANVTVWKFLNGDSIGVNLERLPAPFDTIPIYTDLNYFNNICNYDFSQVGETYFLKIESNFPTVTANTIIPNTTPLDCLWVEENEEFEGMDIRAIYSDPPGVRNNIIIKSKLYETWRFDSSNNSVNKYSEDLLRIIDAGSDILIDGQSFETFFPKPPDNDFPDPTDNYKKSRWKKFNNPLTNLQDSVFLYHDIVLLKFSQIDEASLKFWRSLVRQFGTNGNPFSEPANLVTNIEGGLGCWTGNAPSYYKIEIIENKTYTNPYPLDSLSILDIL